MKVKKEIFILGDIEMGAGTLTDDFISDKALSSLILQFAEKKHEVDLILNGDTFDLLKCPYIVDNQLTYPRYNTEEVSVGKIRSIYESHPRVFEALRDFVKNSKHKVYFIIGNHDQDLLYKGVKREIRKILKGSKRNVCFRLKYNQHKVYVEHGQQYDFLNRMNPERLFLHFKGRILLNVPWISYGIITRFLTLKEQRPFLERINPLPVLFAEYKSVRREVSWRSLEYLLKSILYYPLRYYNDPTYRFPKSLLGEFYKRLKATHFGVDSIVTKFRKRRWKLFGKNKVLVLGHSHESYIEEKDGWVLIHPDTWRDEYVLNDKTKELTAKPKKYVKVEIYENQDLDWKVVEFPIKRSIFNFHEVIKDELKFVQIAAKEEDYAFSKYFTTSTQ